MMDDLKSFPFLSFSNNSVFYCNFQEASPGSKVYESRQNASSDLITHRSDVLIESWIDIWDPFGRPVEGSKGESIRFARSTIRIPILTTYITHNSDDAY